VAFGIGNSSFVLSLLLNDPGMEKAVAIVGSNLLYEI
jgi:hypothetical protein